MVRIRVRGTLGTVKGMLRITVNGMVRINGKCIVTCTVIITVMGTVIHSYLYPLCALVTLLRPATNKAAYRRCLHSNVYRNVRVGRLTPNRQLFLIVPSPPYHLKSTILSVLYLLLLLLLLLSCCLP